MKSVLVTGGAGFIGSHLVEQLIGRDYAVRVLDNLSYGKREWVNPSATFIEGDICDLDCCMKAAEGIDGIFHAAAMSRAGPSLDNIDICTQANIVGTQNVLSAGRAQGVKKIVYSGSSTYYGNQPAPHREYITPGEFLNFYSLTKHVGEQYCKMFNDVFDVPTVILRYFNVYGPRQPREGAYALVLGIFLKRWADRKALIIHGDGSQRRDFIHVTDIARANIMAYESPCRSGIYNVGSGTNISIKELANLISQDQVHEDRRKGDAEITLADISNIRKDIGWTPSISFENGLKDMMDRVTNGLEI